MKVGQEGEEHSHSRRSQGCGKALRAHRDVTRIRTAGTLSKELVWCAESVSGFPTEATMATPPFREPFVTEEELKLMLRGAELSGAIEEEEQVRNTFGGFEPTRQTRTRVVAAEALLEWGPIVEPFAFPFPGYD